MTDVKTIPEMTVDELLQTDTEARSILDQPDRLPASLRDVGLRFMLSHRARIRAELDRRLCGPPVTLGQESHRARIRAELDRRALEILEDFDHPDRKSASVSLYPRDLAAVEAIRTAISDPDGPPVSDSDAIRDAIHRHPAARAVRVALPRG